MIIVSFHHEELTINIQIQSIILTVYSQYILDVIIT